MYIGTIHHADYMKTKRLYIITSRAVFENFFFFDIVKTNNTKKPYPDVCVCAFATLRPESPMSACWQARRWRRRCVKYRAAPRTRDQYAPKTRVHARCLFHRYYYYYRPLFFFFININYYSPSPHVPWTKSPVCTDGLITIIIRKMRDVIIDHDRLVMRVWDGGKKRIFFGSNTIKKKHW